MRIIAGKGRGKRLSAPRGSETRPTTDKVKEALFGRLQFQIPGTKVLDLFAGSGGLGLEALSRGAAFAVFVDSGAEAARVIRKNIESSGFEDKSRVIRSDFEKTLKMFDNKEKFDIVFLDPPYKSGYYQKAMQLLSEGGLLSENALVAAESGVPLGEFEGYRLEKQKKYGETYLNYYTMAAENESMRISGEF